MNFSSKIFEELVHELGKLPGVGKKTALRYALFLIRQDPKDNEHLAGLISSIKSELKQCRECHNITEQDICEICSNEKRDETVLCVVEDIRDVMAIEGTGQFRGKYHVLGGVISPMDGVGPSDLNINTLVERAGQRPVKEIILALSTTMEGDTTNFYIYKKLKDLPLVISTPARGLSIGDGLEYADEITLGRSLMNRLPFESQLNQK
jgi:recombination protein RecR